MPVPRMGSGGFTRSHTESPWEGFLLHRALFLLLVVVNSEKASCPL